ncbi:UNVERIFIED_CONTAM: hypothetical protein HDU68_006523 [Siphonaria sp. JEL0065]|nr:hypothetical protein HDU68_006523 [Siphonaria sp. JEL0065]
MDQQPSLLALDTTTTETEPETTEDTITSEFEGSLWPFRPQSPLLHSSSLRTPTQQVQPSSEPSQIPQNPFKSSPIVASTQLNVFSTSPSSNASFGRPLAKSNITVLDDEKDPVFAFVKEASLPIDVPAASVAIVESNIGKPNSYSGYRSLIDFEGGELRSIDAVAVLKTGGSNASTQQHSRMGTSGPGNNGNMGDLSNGLNNPTPVSQKRSKDWHDLFPNISQDELLLDDWSCAWQREVLIQGRMYLSERHVCFNANIFGWAHSLTLDLDDMISVEKKSIGGFIPNSIEIATMLGQKHYFASFIARDSTYDSITRQWGNSSRAIHMKTFNKLKHALVDDDDDASSETSSDYTTSNTPGKSLKASPVKLNDDTTLASSNTVRARASIDAIGMWSLSMIRGGGGSSGGTKADDIDSRPTSPADEYSKMPVMDRRLSVNTIAQIKGLAELASKSEPTSPTSTSNASLNDVSAITGSLGNMAQAGENKNIHVVHQKHPVVLPSTQLLPGVPPPPPLAPAFVAPSSSLSSPPDSPNTSIIDLTPHLESIERRKAALAAAAITVNTPISTIKATSPTPVNTQATPTLESSSLVSDTSGSIQASTASSLLNSTLSKIPVIPVQLAKPEGLIETPSVLEEDTQNSTKRPVILTDEIMDIDRAVEEESVVWTGSVKPTKSSKNVAKSLSSREGSLVELHTLAGGGDGDEDSKLLLESDSLSVRSSSSSSGSYPARVSAPSRNESLRIGKGASATVSPIGTGHLPPLPRSPSPSPQLKKKASLSTAVPPTEKSPIRPGSPLKAQAELDSGNSTSSRPTTPTPAPISSSVVDILGSTPNSSPQQTPQLLQPPPDVIAETTPKPIPVLVQASTPQPPRNHPTTCPCRAHRAKLTPVLIATYPNTTLETVWNTFYSTPAKVDQFLSQCKNVTSGYKSTEWRNGGEGLSVFTPDAVPNAALYVKTPKPLEYERISVGMERRGEYVTPLTNPMGPKSTRCFVNEVVAVGGTETIKQGGECFCILQSSATPDVPSGNCFLTRVRICWTRSGVDGADVRVEVGCEAEFVKSSWIQGIIQGAVIDGMKTYYKEFDTFLRESLKSVVAESAKKLKQQQEQAKSSDSKPQTPAIQQQAKASSNRLLSQPLGHPLEDEMDLMDLQVQERRQPTMVSLITLDIVKNPLGSRPRSNESQPPPRSSSLVPDEVDPVVPFGSSEFWKALKVVFESLVASPSAIVGLFCAVLVVQLLVGFMMRGFGSGGAKLMLDESELKKMVAQAVDAALASRDAARVVLEEKGSLL